MVVNIDLMFEVPGEPRGKGRPRFNRQMGHAYTDSQTKSYENKIVACYYESTGGHRWPDSAFIAVEVIAHYQIPKSATKAARAAMEAGTVRPTRRPDIDNVLKAVLDALNGVAYKDDSRVVFVAARKIYGNDPKLVIQIKGSD